MTDSPTTVISHGSRIRLHLTFTDSQGEVRLTTFGEEPAQIEIGQGHLTPRLEQVLIGLTTGDQGEVKVAAIDAFGEHDDDRVKAMPRSGFATDMELKPGLLIGFETPHGETAGLILEMNDEHVLVDFNHPLSGEPLSFRYQIIDVQPASNT